jgi:hypothetical protein
MVFLEAHQLTWSTREALLLRMTTDKVNGPERLAHLYAKEYVELGYVNAADFREFFKFAVVRDPYARLMSEYRYREAWQDMSIDRFLGVTFDSDWSDAARHLAPQIRYVCDHKGRILVNHIVRFENLEAEMAPIFRRIFGEDRPLPHRNKSQSGRGTVDDLSKSQITLITEKYSADFVTFGYPTKD